MEYLLRRLFELTKWVTTMGHLRFRTDFFRLGNQGLGRTWREGGSHIGGRRAIKWRKLPPKLPPDRQRVLLRGFELGL